MRNQNDYERTRRADGTGAFWTFVHDFAEYAICFAGMWVLICLLSGEWLIDLLCKGEIVIGVIYLGVWLAEKEARK